MPPDTALAVAPSDTTDVARETFAVLDGALKAWREDDATAFMVRLIEGLGELRVEHGPAAYTAIVVPLARRHEVARLAAQDPFTSHSASQPRGYPGDADLLDIIYRHSAAASKLAAATLGGKSVSAFCLETAACRAVRERRTILAERLDALPLGAEVMSLACGHLREAELSEAVADHQIARFIAADQDERSLAVVAESAGRLSPAVQPLRLRVRDVLAGEAERLGGFDFIYAAGLYDYLPDPVAALLTWRLFDRLKPGGRLMIGNYLPGLWELPYMEAYLHWSLIYRTPDEIRALAANLPPEQVADLSYFGDRSGCVGYLDVTRA